LLDLHATPESTVLDIGCGAGQPLCRLGSRVKHIWGLDQQEDQLTMTRLRAEHLNLSNVTLLRGVSSNEEDMAKLPDKTFDLAFSRRGPNISAPIARSLKDNAIVVQELVSNFDAYPLGEIFGRRGYNLNSFTDQQVILSNYFHLGLFPVSCKEYFYVEYYRDIEHLDQQLNQLKVILSNWLSNYQQPPKPYDSVIDRPALELYVRYNTTPKGIKLLRQRKIFVLRKTVDSPYPADALSTDIH
jgi:SAM-dependent methyltransferase